MKYVSIRNVLLLRLRRFGIATVMLLGMVSTSLAEVDLSGVWLITYHEDWREVGPGPDMGDFAGLPINEAARRRALAWHPSLINVPERQCMPVPLEYTNLWSNLRLWNDIRVDTQEVIAWHLHKSFAATERVFWLDRRSHPSSLAPHTYAGFSTAEWDGDTLKVKTTHLKEGYSRRNGVARSDRATVVEHYIRHGDQLTISIITDDPVYLTEPRIRTVSYLLSLRTRISPYPCEVVTELASIGRGEVPSYFPWKNPYIRQFADKYQLPLETALGDARQMYPEFVERSR